MDELFSTDPEKLTDDDIGTIVTKLRQSRSLWMQAEQTKGKSGAVTTPLGKTISIEDLGL